MNLPTETLASANGRRRALHQSMTDLELAVAGPAAAPGWLDGVRGGLRSVRSALEAHIVEVEGPSGLLADIVAQAPRLQAATAELADDHRALVEMLGRADRDVAEAEADGATGRAGVRRRVIALLGRLAVHRQSGADLVYDAYNVDIAASD